MSSRLILSVIILFAVVSCDSKMGELEERKETAEQKLQETKEMHRQAEKVIQQKTKIGQHGSSVDPNKQVDLFGSVAVWGERPGTMGDAQGIVVYLRNMDKGNVYTAFVGPDNRFKVGVIPGRYTLTINEPGYELHEEEINVDGRLNSELLRPIGLKNQ